MHMLLPIFNLLWTEGKGVFNRIWVNEWLHKNDVGCLFLDRTKKNKIWGIKGKAFAVFPGHVFTCSATSAEACLLCQC